MSRRYLCKRSRALELLNEVDRDKTRLGQQEQDMNKQSNDKGFVPEVHTH